MAAPRWMLPIADALMKKRGKVIGVALLAVAALIALGWVFVVPGELKTLVRFSRWHDSHLRASG